ncbi:MAG TPA: XrtA/PEP-CTERM system histidine kinase PrsK [Methylomirabilota bacterium]|nr:XrtA/PEP-CTERM system histidine kinase PrsK [Methylomirabilota bacterium]
MDTFGSSVHGVTLAAAALSALLLALGAAFGASRPVTKWSFVLGMVGFAAEAGAAFALVTVTEQVEDRLFWLRAHQVASLGLLVPWGVFVVSLFAPVAARWSTPLRLGHGAGGLALGGVALAVATQPAFRLPDIPAPFYAAQLDRVGQISTIVQLIVTVALLGALDTYLRGSRHEDRWRMKYLVVGLGGVFLVRFFLLSQMLLFHVLLGVYLTTAAATLVLGNLAVGASLIRTRFLRSEVTVSRDLVYRSLVVVALGGYLLVVGALGWLLNYLGIPEELLWSSVLIFVSALALGSVLLSENVRWRLKRFIARHFYRTKYDYREQWLRFTERLGSRISLDELGPELISGVTEAAGSARGALYLAEAHGGRFHLAGEVELGGIPTVLEPSAPLPARLAGETQPVLLSGALREEPPGSLLGEGAVAVPLRWSDHLVGLMLVGPERAANPFTAEDLEFFMTVGEQAAGAITTARLSETLAQAREFEAFHRLTSFVIHDLKNAVAALSMLSQNALQHFDDPEFQKDALKTLSRTVDRQKMLLARLTAAPEAGRLRTDPVDLSALALEATRPLDGGRVSLVKEFGAISTVPGDAEALLKVIQNLVTNAVESMKGSGTVTVRSYEEAGAVVCEVADTGCGMSAEFIQKSLFAPFKSTKSGGWGIGLYQAKGIVEAHGGRIEVTSREGMGSVFRLRLPLARHGAGEAKP